MAEVLGAFLMKQISGGPKKPPPMLPPKKAPEPPKTASVPLTPGNLPTEGQENSNAVKADEKRRILKGMPEATEKEFAGSKDKAPIQKKRLLGAGKSGRETTGAAI